MTWRPCWLCFVPECYTLDEHDPNFTCPKCDYNIHCGPEHPECNQAMLDYMKQVQEEGEY